MERNEMTDIMMALLRSEIAGGSPPEASAVEALGQEGLHEVVRVCNMLDVTEALFAALKGCGALKRTDALYGTLTEIEDRDFLRLRRLSHTQDEIARVLSEAGIRFTPLKGAVMRRYYPSPLLRMSADIDVLVRECDLDGACRALVEAGFELTGKKGFHDISLYSADGMHLELHYNVKENDGRLDRTLCRAFDYILPPAEGEYECRFTPEFFAFHIITHMTYHFINGGCGIRPFADLWIWRHKVGFGEGEVRALCAECGIEEFYDNAIALSEVWFSGLAHTPLTRKMESHVLYNGVCAGVEKGIVVRQSKKGSRAGYLLGRIFMPHSQLKIRYPIVGKCPPLLPVFEVVRWVSFLFGDKKRVSREIAATKTVTPEQMRAVTEFLSEVGL